MVNEKPNTTGMDWSLLRLRDIFALLLHKAGIDNPEKNMQAAIQCASWTDRSLEVATCATVVEDLKGPHIGSLPSQQTSWLPVVVTEMRGMGSDLNAVIKSIPRGQPSSTINMNTADTNGSNVRQQMNRMKVSDPNLCAIATNVCNDKADVAEKTLTLAVVSEVMPPGARTANARGSKRSFNDFSCGMSSGRHCSIGSTDDPAGAQPMTSDMKMHVLPYSNLFTLCFAGLVNKSGLCAVEINEVMLAALDYQVPSLSPPFTATRAHADPRGCSQFVYVHQHVSGILHPDVMGSFNRMKEGYIARCVAKAVWTRSIQCLAEASLEPDSVKEQVGLRLVKAVEGNALPLGDVLLPAFNFLVRGVNMAGLLFTSVFAKRLKAPLVTLKQLQLFLLLDDLPAAERTVEDGAVVKLIHDFFVECLQRNRFCPETASRFDPSSNASFYVTDDGTDDGRPREKDSVLRVTPPKVQIEPCFDVARSMEKAYGPQLKEVCHMPRYSRTPTSFWPSSAS